ncbi:MAG TPA: YihY/virulence factor BrkB family protein, partial [Candidatus Eisenbacteria bacterium]|nr:YihY/virulence factor BrkB family protein [Candidatus Eisenbacteria bacterium]
RVHLTAALGGGFIAGTAWELAKLVFAGLSRGLFNYNAVYGSLGVLPVFLLWLQVGWIIVLFGAKVTYATQYAEALRNIQPVKDIGQRLREWLAVLSMVQVVRAHRRGDPPPTSVMLAASSGAPVEIQQRVLNQLVHTGCLVRVADCESLRAPCRNDNHRHGRKRRGVKEADEEGYLPAREGTRMTVQEILDALRNNALADNEVEQALSRESVAVRVREVLDRVEDASSQAAQTLTLAEMVERMEPQIQRAKPRVG